MEQRAAYSFYISHGNSDG